MTLLAAAVIAGCDSEPTAPAGAMSGRYVLKHIDGFAPPATVVDGTLRRIIFTEGALQLKPTGVFTDSTKMIITDKITNETTTRFDLASGLYTISNDTIYFRSVNRPGEHYVMVIQADRTLKQRINTTVLTYER